MNVTLTQILLVAIGGAFGSVARFLSMSAIGHIWKTEFPYGTLTVNIIGSFMMGILVGILAKILPGDMNLRLLFGVGILGGFTTFSAFSLDVVTLLERGATLSAIIYVLSSILLSVIGLFAGLYMIRTFA